MKAAKAARVTERAPLAAPPENDEALLVRLEKDGIVRRGTGGPIPVELLQPGPKCKRPDVLETLLANRRSGR